MHRAHQSLVDGQEARGPSLPCWQLVPACLRTLRIRRLQPVSWATELTIRDLKLPGHSLDKVLCPEPEGEHLGRRVMLE